jgi:hypothetical protein
MTRAYDSPIVPSREVRYTADAQKILTVTEDPYIALDEAKSVLHVYHGKDDVYIGALIDGVIRQVEGYIRQDVMEKTRQAYWRRNQRLARLPYGPHGDITAATMIDSNGDTTTLTEGTHFDVIGITFKSLCNFEQFGQLTVSFESGWDTPPPEVKAAVYQELSLQYKNRQDPDVPSMTSYRNLSLEARHLLAPIMRLAL